MTSQFHSIEAAIHALQQGKMVILVDDESRENEGDLVISAQHVRAEDINFMATHARGLICLPMSESLIERLGLPMMTLANRSPYGTAFTVSIEAAEGVSTGISAEDRAKTIHVAIDPNSQAKDVISPGHVFPLRARSKGVLERAGQTEGSVDLMKLAGLRPAAVICEIMNQDGSMSRQKDLQTFAKEHQILMISIHDLIAYRVLHERLVSVVASTRLPLQSHGDFLMKLYQNDIDSHDHFALIKGELSKTSAPLVRIHSECITGDVFHSCKCDCGEQLQSSLAMIAEQGGVLIYLRQEGRGVGLVNKIKAYALQDQGLDTVDANLHLGLPVDNRDYALGYQILKDLGVTSLRLLTNNPEKQSALEHYGLTVTERIPVLVPLNPDNQKYLTTKEQKLGHYLNLDKRNES